MQRLEKTVVVWGKNVNMRAGEYTFLGMIRSSARLYSSIHL